MVLTISCSLRNNAKLIEQDKGSGPTRKVTAGFISAKDRPSDGLLRPFEGLLKSC